MKHFTIISSGFVALFMAVIAGIVWYKQNYPSVDSFAACEKAGYKIEYVQPRICKAGVKRFVEPAD